MRLRTFGLVPSAIVAGLILLPASSVLAAGGPSITIVSSNAGTASGAIGALIGIGGSGFGSSQGTSTVTFNGTVATTVSNWSSTSIQAIVPQGATTGNVVVTVSGKASNGVLFTVLPTPVITSISPTSGAIGTPILISGHGFSSTQGSVVFGGSTNASISSWSDSLIVAAVPAGPSGTVAVNASGVQSNSLPFNGWPYITSVSPGIGPAGTAVTISGYNFGASHGSSSITLNGAPVTNISSWSSTSITAAVPQGAITGNVVVTVSGEASNGISFTVGTLSTSPYHLHQETGGMAGTDLLSTAATDTSSTSIQSPNLNGVANGTVTSIKTFTTSVPVPGYIPLGTTITFSLWMQESAAVAGLYPNVTAEFLDQNGLPYTLCTTTGSSQLTTTITKLQISCTTSYVMSPTVTPKLYANVSVINNSGSSLKKSVTASVYLEGAAGGNYDSSVVFPALFSPYIQTFWPFSGSVGTSITITGANFGSSQGTSTVNFNGTAATPSAWSDTSITVPVPLGATSGPLEVVRLGESANFLGFIVDPTISSISPAAGPLGTVVTISGSHFGATQGTNAISFNGVPSLATLWSDTSIVVPVPPGTTTGPVSVTINNLTSNSVVFTVGPTIASASPASGSTGTTVTIQGLNFGTSQGSGTLSFNGALASPSNWSDSQIVTLVPAGASSGPLVVTVNGTQSNGLNFTVGNGAISGTVSKSSDGTAISGATLQVFNAKSVVATATSGSDGSYIVNGLLAGTYEVNVSASGYGVTLVQGITVTAGTASTVNVSLSSPGTVSGQVTAANGGAPVSGATVNILQAGDLVASATSNSSGNYSISTIGSGTYSAEAFASGFRPETQTGLVVSSGNTTSEDFSLSGQSAFTYTYDPVGRLIGVVDPQGNAVTYQYDAVGNLESTNQYSASQISIIGFSPSQGPLGTTVTISGSGFSTTASQNSVSFNGTAATVTSATATQIVVSVPTGATTGAISVTSPQGTANSSTPFTVSQ